MMSVNIEVKKDMLSIHSTVQEMLRALYFYASDYIMVIISKKERLLHKDQLIALLEQGRESATVEDMTHLVLSEPLSARAGMEDVPPESALLVFSDGELLGTTFEKYREMKIQEAMIHLPAWWGVPLPLLHVKDDRISLNGAALELIPGGTKALAEQSEKIKSDKLIVIKDKKVERTFSLSALDDETYLIEDVSGDFEIVEDLVWWAAIGSAFVRRMEENGLRVRRISPNGAPPDNATEIIPCSWEGELVGRLAIELPEADITEAQETQADSAAKEDGETGESLSTDDGSNGPKDPVTAEEEGKPELKRRRSVRAQKKTDSPETTRKRGRARDQGTK
jgi:hypothetical protein